MILVNAANGQQGKLLVPRLLAAGLRVRGCVQSDRSAAELRAIGVSDVVVGDICRPDVIARAIKGVTKLYHAGCSAALRPVSRRLLGAISQYRKRPLWLRTPSTKPETARFILFAGPN